MSQIQIREFSHPGALRRTTKPNAGALLAVAESMAFALADNYQELGLGSDAEALLRASMAAVDFWLGRHLTMLEQQETSIIAPWFLAEVKGRCDRSIEQLHRRITQSMSQLCRIMDEKDLMRVGSLIVSISS